MTSKSHEQNVLELARVDRRNLFDAKRLKSAIETAHLDAVVALSAVNVTYTGGAYTRGGPSQAAVTTVDGTQALVLDEADAYFFREYSWVKDIRSFRYGRDMAGDAIDLLADTLHDMNLGSGRIGVETAHLTMKGAEQLSARVPKATFTNAGPVFEHTRLVKTPGEVALFRVAAQTSMKAIQTAWAISSPGDTEKRVAARMQSTALELGADALSHCHLHAGVHSTIAHTWPLEQPIQRGEVVHIDFGAVFGGYQTDLSRNAIVLEASPTQETIYRKLWDIQHSLFDKVRPGAVACELWEFGQNEMKRAGLVHPWGTLGHGTGLAIHEGFEISQDSAQPFEAGMLINLEPSHIEKGDARYHIEDTVLVTPTGYELLSDLLDSPTLTVIR